MSQERTEQQQWDEAKEAVQNFECAVCGGRLGVIWYEGEWRALCARDPKHEGQRRIRSLTELHREGAAMPLSVVEKIERRSPLARGQEEQALSLAQHQWPDLDRAAAAVFLSRCVQVGLDPFFGEAAPLVFTSQKRQGLKIVVFFPTRKGRGVLAAREEPEKWKGPPQLRAVTEAEEKKKLGFNEDDWVAEAKGITSERPADNPLVIYSAYYRWEYDKDKGNEKRKSTPAALRPQNQAMVRAERHWYEEGFPFAEAKARAAMAAMLKEQGEEPAALQSVIEGKYRIVDEEEVPGAGRPRAGARALVEPLPGDEEPDGGTPDRGLLAPATAEQKTEVLKRAQEAGVAETLVQLIPILKAKGVEWATMTVGQAGALQKEWATPRPPQTAPGAKPGPGRLPGV